MNIWKPFDWLGDRIGTWLTPAHQRRLGAIMLVASTPLIVVGFILSPVGSWEFLLYQMSAFALLFGGLATIVAAVPSE